MAFPKQLLTRRRLAAALLLALGAAGAFWWQQQRKAPKIETARLAKASIEANVMAVGTLQPRSYVDIGAQVSGQILRLHVTPGATVSKGQLLVEIDPSVQQATVDAGRAALAGLNAQLSEQRAQHRLAGQQHVRQQQLARDGATREEDMQLAVAALETAAARIANLQAQIQQTQATLKADEARLGYTRIYAPMSGTVVSVEAREGQTLNATYQTPNVLRVADLSGMTVWTEVSEADVRRVKPGMPVYFSTLGGNQRRWHGKVRQLLPAPPQAEARNNGTAITPSSGKVVLYTALFDVDNSDGELMPQMTAQVHFVTASVKNVLVAPLPALTALEGKPGQFSARVMNQDGAIEQRVVQVGVRNRLSAEVLGGLREGELLVTGEMPSDSASRFQL
ncbi:efflux RND transporter periplasmic adaptor subunit [Massilia sp. YIM B04103]|uniref:efflux RND transporter periplasmic adaptor subunit n=1 Tax=Massilia sp. YIM B04103 TaxID=2963106 RepID=UPI002109F2BF|nr:efflux RND transporter periplasmic adaptor subunit [Massilia sp. YIM B04103]